MDNIINNSDNNLRKLAKLVAEEIFKLIEIKQFDEMFMDWFKKNIHNFLKEKFKEEKIFNFEGTLVSGSKKRRLGQP